MTSPVALDTQVEAVGVAASILQSAAVAMKTAAQQAPADKEPNLHAVAVGAAAARFKVLHAKGGLMDRNPVALDLAHEILDDALDALGTFLKDFGRFGTTPPAQSGGAQD